MQPLRPQKLTDVRPPEAKPGEGELAPMFLEAKPKADVAPSVIRPSRKMMPELRQAAWIFCLLIVTLILGFGVMRFSSLQERISWAMAATKDLAQTGFIFPTRSTTSLATNSNLEAGGVSSSSFSFNNILRRASISDIWTIFMRGGDALDDFQKTFENYKSLAADLSSFVDSIPQVFLDSQTGPLPTLYRIRTQVNNLEASNSQLSSSLTEVKDVLPVDFSEYVALGSSLHRISDLLDNGIRWLESPHRVVVAFQNSSEMRPSGGFFGSYAEVVLVSGIVKEIVVRDITEADKTFEETIIPPKPLQYIVKNWRAADSNWYFDFPRSASQMISFLEKSNLYQASGTKFDTVLAISPRVLEDILAITGPLELTDRKVTLTAENFLPTIQGDVVSGRADKASDPKGILAEVVTVLKTRLSKLPSDQKNLLVQTFVDWIRYKDIQVFSQDQEFESVVRFFGADGSIASSSATQNNDYLAIVDSTIGGEKTNHVMSRKISWRAQIETDGRVVHELTITRKHNGDKESVRWYKVPNRNYVRVLTAPGSRVLGSSGFIAKPEPTRVYDETYKPDSTLMVFEESFKDVLGMPNIKTFEEGGKVGVAGWTTTEAGKETKSILSYEHRLPQGATPGTTYSFIFDKQAGTEGSYTFEIDAPVGYRFKENLLPIFEYKSEDVPGRVVVNLTLEKI